MRRVFIRRGSAVLAVVAFAALVLAPASNGATAGPSGRWSTPLHLTAEPLYAVSCATAEFCVAVGAGGSIFQFDGTRWQRSASFPAVGRLWSVDCPSARSCVAVGDHGMVTFFDGSTWSTPVDDDPGRVLSAVACWSARDCLVGDSSSLMFTLTDRKAGTPSFVDTYATYFTAYTSMSCVPGRQPFCAAVDSSGSLLSWRAGKWASTRLATDPPVVSILAGDVISAVSCASASDCVAVTDAGGLVRWNGASWSVPQPFDPHGVVSAAIACTSPERCLLVDDSGDAYVVSRTGGVAGSPERVSPPDPIGLAESLPIAMSCPSSSFCAVVTGNGEETTLRG